MRSLKIIDVMLDIDVYICFSSIYYKYSKRSKARIKSQIYMRSHPKFASFGL